MDELERIWEKALSRDGRRPYRQDLARCGSRFSQGPYYRRWGAWIRACEAVLDRYWSKEDEAFVAEVPELPGSVAHGPTQEAALTSAQEAIRLWIDTAKESGDPIPEPKGRRLIFA